MEEAAKLPIAFKFVRGDTMPFKTPINLKDGTSIRTEDIGTLFITAREKPLITAPIIFQKTLEDVTIDQEGYLHVIIEPEDTQELPYGEYFFDIQITSKTNYRKTRLFKFKLTGETTIYGGDNNGNGN